MLCTDARLAINFREVSWGRAIWELWDPYLGDAGGSLKNIDNWRRFFSLPLYNSYFLPPEEIIVRHASPTTKAGIQSFVLSASGVAAQPEDEKAKITERVGDIIDKGEGLVWIDKEKGVFEQPFAAPVVIMHRKA